MKRLCISALIPAIVSCGTIFGGTKMPSGKLIAYEYVRNGMRSAPEISYFISLDGDSAIIKSIVSIRDTIQFRVSSFILDEIRNVMVHEKMNRFKKSYHPLFKVLDGHSWHYHADFDDGSSLHSSGENASPNSDCFIIINQIIKRYIADSKIKDMPQSAITSYSYELRGNVTKPLEAYNLKVDDNQIIISATFDGVDKKGTASLELFDKIREVIRTEQMFNFQNTYSPEHDVLDGYSWHYMITFANGINLSSNGANAGPDSTAFEQIHKLIKDCLK